MEKEDLTTGDTHPATLLAQKSFFKHRFCFLTFSRAATRTDGSVDQPCRSQRSRPACRMEAAGVAQREAQQSQCCTNISSVPSVRRSSTNLWSFCHVSIIFAGNVPTSSTRCVCILTHWCYIPSVIQFRLENPSKSSWIPSMHLCWTTAISTY